MKLTEFDFELPKELIAQEPSKIRGESSILVAEPEIQIAHKPFASILDYLLPGDVMVFNDSKVIKAKLILHKEDKKVEIYLHKMIEPNRWRAFSKPAKRLSEGDIFYFDDTHSARIDKKLYMGEIEITFNLHDISIFEFLDKYGHMPLPPYIKRNDDTEKEPMDEDRYQTIYSSEPGSVAAPTAGLHFTKALLDKIDALGVIRTKVTLHVGAGTFLPVKTDDIELHKMHSEYCQISTDATNIINQAKQEGRRVIAVGTTSVRTLESRARNGLIQGGAFETDIFIKPGFKFQIIDKLLTNFHLPKSTLFILTCAFAGYNKMFEIYKFAIDNKMRFFSYGDACLLTKSDKI